MSVDNFAGQRNSLSSPAHAWKTVTPHDSNPLPGGIPKFLHIGGTSSDPASGSISCIDADNNTAVFYVNRGDFIPIRPNVIKSTGTTANLVIIACY